MRRLIEMRLKSRIETTENGPYNTVTIGFDPYLVEFKKNLGMSQECEKHIYNHYKTYSHSNELLSTAQRSSQMLSQLILMITYEVETC